MLSFFKISSLPIRSQMLILSGLFILYNVVTLIIGDLEQIRIARVISTLAAVLFFTFKVGHYSKKIYILYILQMFASIGYWQYDSFFGPPLFLIASTIIYLIISSIVIHKIEWKLIKRYEYFIYVLIFLINIVYHFYNVNSFEAVSDQLHLYLLLLVTGFLGISSCLLVGFSNSTKNTFDSAYFMYATFAFVFADFAAMVAYYFELFPQRFYFIERACYLFGLYILTRYSYLDFKAKKDEENESKKSSLDSTSLEDPL